jgi:hypothetical protein
MHRARLTAIGAPHTRGRKRVPETRATAPTSPIREAGYAAG